MDRQLEEQFEAFVRARYHRLFRIAFLLCGDRGHAEDAVQTTLAKTFLIWPRLSRSGEFDNYVRKILINWLISSRRRRWWSETPHEGFDLLPGGDPYDGADDRDALRRALILLPARQRAAVVLRHYEDLSEAHVAQLLGCSVGTVKSLTSRGLERLRSQMTAPVVLAGRKETAT
ncbi:SigE family RNA polymerase sigma factor [Hamadaea sp. NPDC051192]|uniref:SigE family RNA polymerase sigma factor n=1 Tax=Hamadaea sp. NPDC051192 TaxID=3154940 RepID=UPI00341CFD07